MAKNVTLWGASYSNVPAINVPQTGGGTARFTDTSPTTAVDADVAQGKIYFKANGQQSVGTGEGGGGGGASAYVGVGTESTFGEGSRTYTGIQGQPKAWIVYAQSDVTPTSNGCLMELSSNGTESMMQYLTTAGNVYDSEGGYINAWETQVEVVLSNSNATFGDFGYKFIYLYGDAEPQSKTVQVGSGATAITFTGLDGEPVGWWCTFKADFSTSMGYQRVIAVANDGSTTDGISLDSGSHVLTSWTASYSNGSFTITSNSTNDGGYFHQPGYYQLTYMTTGGGGSGGNYQTKNVTYTPTTQIQTQSVTADSGYDALEAVYVTVNAMPSMTLPSSSSSIASGTSKATITPTSSVQYLNIPTGYNATAQYYTIGASGGGGNKNVQISQSTTRNNASSLTKANGDLTVSKTGTYDIYWTASRSNTSTSYTWGSRLYVDGTAYGTENTTWSNNVQNNHLSNVSLTANQKLSVYTRGRSGNYYTYAPMLVIVEN